MTTRNPYEFTPEQVAARAEARRRRAENTRRYLAAKEQGKRVNTRLPAFEHAMRSVTDPTTKEN